MLVLLADLMLVNSFYLLWLGLGMMPVGALLLFAPNLPAHYQTLVWALCSFLLIAAWRFLRKAEEAGDDVAALTGATCIVVSWEGGRGQARLQRPFDGRDVWDAAAEPAAAIKKGDTCRIVAVDRKAKRITLAKT